MPQTLKFIQNSSVCVLHTASLSTAKNIKKPIHLIISLSHPASSNYMELSNNFFKKFLFKTIFPKNKVKAKIKFIMVGFKYIKIGLSKKIVSPPNKHTRTAPIRGRIGILFSSMYMMHIAINVAIIKVGIAEIKSLSFL